MATIFVCGDVVNHYDNPTFIGDRLAREIQKADYAICNFEGPELREGQSARRPHQGAGTAKYLKDCGFELMLLANNHITEFGEDGVRYSIETIRSVGSTSVGAGLSWDEAYQPVRTTIQNQRFAFLNVCEAQVGQFLSKEQAYGYAWMGYNDLLNDVEQLAAEVDFVVVFVHAGLEHVAIPLPEIRAFYRRICDAGASVVIGGHTHTAQGYEMYRGKPIVYSLGNFFFPHAGCIRTEENTSYSVMLSFDKGIIAMRPVYHHLVNDKVEMTENESEQVDLDKLCNMLGEEYEHYANAICVAVYDKLCSHLLAEATCGEFEGISLKQWVATRGRQILQRMNII